MNIDPILWGLLACFVAASVLILAFHPSWSSWSALAGDQAIAATEIHTQVRTRGRYSKRRPGLSRAIPSDETRSVFVRWQPPAGSKPWGLKGWRVREHLEIAAGHQVPCGLAVLGRLNVNGPAVIEGDISTRDQLRLGAGTRVEGQLLCQDDIWLGEGCQVHGAVMSEGRLHMAPGVVIGQPDHPVSVIAREIEVQGIVQIHGCIQTRERRPIQC